MKLLLVLLAFTSTQAQITDSLVTDLSCQGLSRENVLQYVDRSKLSSDLHIPFRNWGANLIGQCWALTSAQRKIFYLSRLGVAGSKAGKKDYHYAIDSFRGFKKASCSSDLGGAFSNPQDCGEVAVKPKVLEIPEEEFYYSKAYESWFDINAKPFKAAIEQSQQRKFYNLGAIGFATASTQVSKEKSQREFRSILRAYERGGMPSVILRMSTMSQHVVLIKEIIEENDGSFKFRIYDSNLPYNDFEMFFRKGYFYASDSIGLFNPQQANSPVDVALVDEAEMEEIRTAVFQYYKSKCK